MDQFIKVAGTEVKVGGYFCRLPPLNKNTGSRGEGQGVQTPEKITSVIGQLDPTSPGKTLESPPPPHSFENFGPPIGNYTVTIARYMYYWTPSVNC